MCDKDMQKMMSAVALSKEEIESFLLPPRIARLSTVKDNGKPCSSSLVLLQWHKHTCPNYERK